jgi:hypothetical protein
MPNLRFSTEKDDLSSYSGSNSNFADSSGEEKKDSSAKHGDKKSGK